MQISTLKFSQIRPGNSTKTSIRPRIGRLALCRAWCWTFAFVSAFGPSRPRLLAPVRQKHLRILGLPRRCCVANP